MAASPRNIPASVAARKALERLVIEILRDDMGRRHYNRAYRKPLQHFIPGENIHKEPRREKYPEQRERYV